MEIRAFAIPRFDLSFHLCWSKSGEFYYIQYFEYGEWVEDFSDLPEQPLPENRDDAAAIEAARLYVRSVEEEFAGNTEPVPDWEAQARYDEIHGTVNGEDPNIAAWREAFPYGG